MKVKASKITKKDLQETHEIQLRNARALFAARPFVTKTWMCMRGFSMVWLNANWDKITNY